MPEHRTFSVRSPHMHGTDVEAWQEALLAQCRRWRIRYPLKVDGDYGVATRSATAFVLRGLGIDLDHMAEGVTPELRVKVRNRDLTAFERARRDKRKHWRAKQRSKYNAKVAPPMRTITADSWDYHPPGHDGIDLICPADEPLLAIVRSRVIRADAGGWWGKAPTGDVSKGDGIIVLRARETVGPIKAGMNLCYGHAEHAVVDVGDEVKAGQRIGRAGLANVPHVHFMVNQRSDDRGVGDQDPEPIYRYCVKHG